MTHDMLVAALRQAEESEPAVRVAALLRIARVWTTLDRAEAERLLDRGLAQLAELPEEDSAALTPQAICIAACVAPNRAFALRATVPESLRTEKFLYDMVRHGHRAAAVEYLTQWSEPGEFPHDAARDTMAHAADDEQRRGILRSAWRAWHRQSRAAWHSIACLLDLLQFQWHLLPDDEARAEIRHVVHVIRKRPNESLNGSFGGLRGTVRFSSYRPAMLFRLLGALKRLDPQLATSVIREDPELARAAGIYPYGHETDTDLPVEPLSGEALEQWKKDWTGFALGARFFRMEDEKNSDFRDSFDHALRAFARDTDRQHRNAAPAECWPSTEDFRAILYAAGRHEGARGTRLLDRIPDPALRLFAQIELAAGIAGLDRIGGITREYSRGFRSPSVRL